MRQTSNFQRRLAAGAFLMVAAPVALGSVAYACQSLATLQANPASGAAGSSFAVTGRNYSSSATSSPIVIHLDTRDGTAVGSFAPASVLSGNVTLPGDVAQGVHTLIATQYTALGDAVSGTPGRASFSVTVVGGRAGESSAASPAAVATDQPAATAATPAAAVPASAASASSPAAAAGSPAVAAPTAAAAPAAAVASSSPAVTPVVAGTNASSGTPAAPAAATATETPAASTVNVGGILPASSSSSSNLPGFALAGGLALVLLGLAAFFKSGRNVLGGRGFTPLAG